LNEGFIFLHNTKSYLWEKLKNCIDGEFLKVYMNSSNLIYVDFLGTKTCITIQPLPIYIIITLLHHRIAANKDAKKPYEYNCEGMKAIVENISHIYGYIHYT